MLDEVVNTGMSSLKPVKKSLCIITLQKEVAIAFEYAVVCVATGEAIDLLSFSSPVS